MKPFIRLVLPTGHIYEIAAQFIAENRAASMLELHPDEFKTLQESMLDTTELFEDNYEVRDWALNNMQQAELLAAARLVRFTMPEIDLQAADWEYQETQAIIPALDQNAIMTWPLELTLQAMAAQGKLCQLTKLGAPGAEAVLLAVVQSNPAVVEMYSNTLVELTNFYVAALREKAANTPPVVAQTSLN